MSDKADLVKRVGVFGSLARGTFGNESDIDILIEYNAMSDIHMEHFIEFCELCNQMTETLTSSYGRGIDLIHFADDPAKFLQDKNVAREVVWA